jgi:hypothetical protein
VSWQSCFIFSGSKSCCYRIFKEAVLIHVEYVVRRVAFVYHMTPWSRVLEKLTGLQLVRVSQILWDLEVHYRIHKNLPPFPILGQSIQSVSPRSTSWRSIVLLSSHLCLGLPGGLLPSGFLSKTLYAPQPPPPLVNAIDDVHSVLYFNDT